MWQWLKTYGKWILGGIAVIVLAGVGFNFGRDSSRSRVVKARRDELDAKRKYQLLELESTRDVALAASETEYAKELEQAQADRASDVETLAGDPGGLAALAVRVRSERAAR